MMSSWDQDANFTGNNFTATGAMTVAGSAVATLSATQTLTNKTLSAPALNAATVVEATGLTAVGTNQGTALALTADTNNVTTAASSTGVALPVPTIGRRVRIYNNGAHPITVYGHGSDTIDGAPGATGVTLTNSNRCEYECVAAATWLSAQLGAVSS